MKIFLSKQNITRHYLNVSQQLTPILCLLWIDFKMFMM